MATNPSDTDFNTINFERRLTNLKDSQESINHCCQWCLENRQHHKKIVNCWLNVLKRVRIEQRLILFYLANDVIQYSKRRNYDFVESWSTTLQKATTMVRDEKVKHKILRIFKIWEQRGVYGEEFVTDLSGLISATPTARKSDDPQEFQSAYLITKIKSCAKLEADTDVKLKKFKEHNPKMMDGEALCASLKDRAHVDDVEKEMDEYVNHMEAYVNALKLEIKARHTLISLLQQAELHLDTDKKDVKLVANAYRAFATRVKNLKKKLEEMLPTLSSPIPSPDINAPSPSPDSDLELPLSETTPPKSQTTDITHLTYANAGFYNPVPPPTSTDTFQSNGFSSFLGANMPFNIENINAALFNSNTAASQSVNGNQAGAGDIYSSSRGVSGLFPSMNQPPPPPDPVPTPMPVAAPSSADYPHGFNSQQVPLMPPPIPPFSKTDVTYNSNSYTDSYNTDTSTNFGNAPFNQQNNSYTSISSYSSSASPYQTVQSTPSSNFDTQTSYSFEAPPMGNFGNAFAPPPPPAGPSYVSNDEYNPEEEPETWDNEPLWETVPIDLETPESPPNFEKESYSEPVEYHDNQTIGSGVDIDHRMLLGPNSSSESDSGHRKKDVDHRNLISLTGSPKEQPSKVWKSEGDQDYRPKLQTKTGDQDYRMHFNFENLQLPPPPPPPNQQSPNKPHRRHSQSPRKAQDNVESIDMDLSDDESHGAAPSSKEQINDNLKVVTLIDQGKSLEPPPPFPEFSDEADANANNLLDDLNNDLDESDDLICVLGEQQQHLMEQSRMEMMFEQEPPGHMPWNNRIPPPGMNIMPDMGPPPLLHMNGPPPHMRNGPPPDIILPPWPPEFIEFRGGPPGRIGNKRGIFNNRGDFRGRPPSSGRGGGRRGRGGFFRGNRNGRTRPNMFRGRFFRGGGF